MIDLLIDLDNTVYCESSKIFSQIDKKMKDFISNKLNVSQEKAYSIQKKYFLENGTTLRGLMLYHDVEPKDFLNYVHDIDLKSIDKNSLLKKEITKFKGKKIIFTNGTTEHAVRVLNRVGIMKQIDNIFDIENANYIPKPELVTYKKVVNKFNLIPHNTAMIDDITSNLNTAKIIGMNTILIRGHNNARKIKYVDYCLPNLTTAIKKINNKDIFHEN